MSPSEVEKARSSIDTEAQTDTAATSITGHGKDYVRSTFEPVLEPSYEVDPFSAQREFHTAEDYVDFRSMGWIKACLIATAEVCAPLTKHKSYG